MYHKTETRARWRLRCDDAQEKLKVTKVNDQPGRVNNNLGQAVVCSVTFTGRAIGGSGVPGALMSERGAEARTSGRSASTSSTEYRTAMFVETRSSGCRGAGANPKNMGRGHHITLDDVRGGGRFLERD